jgi:uncharacterized protein (DUF362 family)
MSGDDRILRRDLLARVAKAGAPAAVAGGAGYALWSRQAGSAGGAGALEKTWDFAVRDDGPRLAIVDGMNRARTLGAGLAALGGLGRFVKAGDKVVLKVNAGFAKPPRVGAAVHPDTVTALVRACRDAGAADVVVTDNPVNDPEDTFRVTGIGEAAEAAGGRVVLPRPEEFRDVSLPGGDLIRDWPVMAGPLDAATKVIGVATVKDHGLGGATLAIKNWYGLLGGRRNLMHQRMNDILVELARLVRPTLVVVDGTVSMMTNGPTGGSEEDLKPTGVMVVATDPIAADAFAVSLLGRRAEEFAWMKPAAAATGCTADWESLKPLRGHV